MNKTKLRRAAMTLLVLLITSSTVWAGEGETYIVDINGGGQYTSISAAVSAATGGETIFIKNGDYTESATITLDKSLTIEGESQDGVKITGPSDDILFNIQTAVTLTRMTIKNTGGDNKPAIRSFVLSTVPVSVTECSLIDCYCGDGVTCSYVSSTKTLTISKTGEGTGEMTNFSSIDNQPWYVFKNEFTTAIIGDGVTSLGDGALASGSALESVTISNSVVTIGNAAFNTCTSLKSLSFGSGVETIGENVFSYCTSLESITVAEGNTVYDSRNNCNALILKAQGNDQAKLILGSKNTIIPDDVGIIGRSAFYKKEGLTAINIPASVTLIDEYAFEGCTNLAAVTFSGTSQLDKIALCAFTGCSRLTAITIPPSVTYIGENAFYNCSSLASIVVLPTTPPTLKNNNYNPIFGNIAANRTFYCHGNDYSKSNTDWNTITSGHRTIVWGLTLEEGITTTTPAFLTYADYYPEGTTIELSGKPAVGNHIYAVNGTVIGGNTFDMPAADVTITTLPVYALSLADGITAEATPATIVGGTPYYLEGTTITLSGRQSTPELPAGSIYGEGYTVNGTAIRDNTFKMPAEDVTVNSNIIQCYTLTLADGITTEATPATTVGGTPYYRPGTTVTLSGRPTAGGYIYPYLLNGTPLYVDNFTMPASDVTVTIGEPVADWQYGSDGSSESTAYQIKTTVDLELLAQRVNSGNTYKGEYFKLMNDIAYAHTSAWNDATSTENNYTAIGNNLRGFGGTFDGNGHTISGIRIYKGGSNTSSDSYQGLFGYIRNGAVVKNFTLADARITGYENVGGIAGSNNQGTVTGCRVAGDVALHIVQKDANRFGGIAGNNSEGTVNNCTSSVKITVASGITGYRFLGGIVGINNCRFVETFKGTITGCHAIGANMPANTNGPAGAVVGEFYVHGSQESPLSGSANTYHSCLVGTDAFNIGVGEYNTDLGGGNGDFDGASLDNTAFLLDDYMDAPALIAAYADPGKHTANIGTVPNVSGLTATLSRTLYKDGDWNTLCLPFYMTDEEVTAQLAPAALMTLSSSSLSGNTLTLNFTDATEIKAGKPYIIKWPASADNLVNPVFSGVTVNDAVKPVTTDCVDFVGTYTPVSFTADDHSKLLVGTQNKLYYPKSGASLGICRGYFQLKNGLTVSDSNGPAPGLNIQMNFGETTSLSEKGIVNSEQFATARWYTLDGRKLNGKPTQKGVYIHNGKKIVIK